MSKLDYAISPTGLQKSGAYILLRIASIGSAIICLIVCAIWVRSYFTPTTVPPPIPHIPLFVPSDAEQNLVPVRGRLEWWEYTPWDKKWYRMGAGIPMWFVAVAFAIFPAMWWIVHHPQKRSASLRTSESDPAQKQ